MIRMNRIIRGIHTPRNRLLDSTMSSRPRTLLRSLLATGVLTLAGCVNPFLENYVGSRQSATGDPVRVVAKGNAPRLGTSRFSKKMEIGKLPGDDEARAAVTAATQHHRQDKHGRHRYRAEDFDLDAFGAVAAEY